MMQPLACPTCGNTALDLCSYASMLVVRRDLALFKIECPACHTIVSSLHAIPPQLREQVRFAAHEVGAGMGAEG